MSDPIITAKIYATESDVGFNPSPVDNHRVNIAMTDMYNASTVEDIKEAISDIVNAIQQSFESFINDQRTLHQQSILTVADEHATTTQSNNVTTSEIVTGVKEGTASILEEARESRKALGDGILGRISDKVTSFTSSLKPILPSLQTFGIAFATTGLGAMFMTNALISAIKFIFNNPLMFIGSLIGGSILYNMFKEPIDNFITKISDKLKEWLSDILATALTKTVKDSAKTIEGLIDKFSSLNLSSDGLFTNINGSIEKLQKAIDASWGKINKDINATIDKIFDRHFPNAIKKFFETFNTEIPKSIKTIIDTIDKELPNSKEYKTIINTADGVTSALNNFHNLYTENKDRINKLIDNIDMFKGVASYFIPKNDTSTTEQLDDEDMKNIVNVDDSEPKTKPDKPTVSTSKTPVITPPIISPTKPQKSLLSGILKAAGDAISTNAVTSVTAAKENFEKNGSADLEQLKNKTKQVVEEQIAPVNNGVKDIKQGIDDGKTKLDKIGTELGELTKTLKVLVKSVMSKKPTEPSSPNVVVNVPPNNNSTEQRDSKQDDGM
jgi:hypothetical protein